MSSNSEMEEEIAMAESTLSNDAGVSLNAPRKYQLHFPFIIMFIYIYLSSFYGIYLCFTKAKWSTILFNYLMFMLAVIGITAGAHRLWSHRSYKVNMPLEIIIMLFSSVASQYSAFYWVRDHRQHHKYCDTDGDPHNARRGLFYSHIGWVLTMESDEVKRCAKTIDMSDMYNNPVVMFQKKYVVPLFIIFSYVLPTVLPIYWFGETYTTAWHLNMLRYGFSLNVIFLINSAAHYWGYKPYDKTILPTENFCVSLLNLGEGYHNYHHAFPWDYKAGEYGKINVTTWFIDFFAKIGWAYDLKTASDNVVKNRAMKTGDGTYVQDKGEDVNNE